MLNAGGLNDDWPYKNIFIVILLQLGTVLVLSKLKKITQPHRNRNATL